LISKNIIITTGVIIIGLAIFFVLFLKPIPQQNESFVGITSPIQDPYVQEFSLPAGSAPNGLIVDKQGIVWVTSSGFNALYRFDPKSGQLQNYEIKSDNSSSNVSHQNSTMVWTILQDKDNFIWFSPIGTQSIWRFDPAHGTFDKFQSIAGSAFQMKLGKPLGTIWFTTLSGNTLGVLERDNNYQSGYKMTQFNLGNDTAPAGLFVKDNSVWITEITTQKIVHYEITNNGDLVGNITKVEEFPTDNKTTLSSPTDLFVDNGTMWLTEHGTSFLTEFDLSSGTIVRFPTSQNVFHATTLPFWIRGINDGKDLWFNEHEGNKLAYFDTVNKTMIEYNIPSRPNDGYLTYPLNIATDPQDQNVLWFSEWNTDKIGKINGHIQIPFSISADANKVILNNDASKGTVVNLDVTGQSPYSMNRVFVNASSSVEPAAGFGDIDLQISPDVLDLSTEHKSQLILRNYAALPGNYTLGISVSDGLVVKTIFLNLIVPQG
jgi:virginiamycin B lyase